MDTVQIHFFQGVVAFLEGLLIFKEKSAEKAAAAAIVIALSGLVPGGGVIGPAYAGAYNEALWETILATLGGGLVLSGIWGGGFGKNAMKVFILDTSSKTVANEIYTSIILAK